MKGPEPFIYPAKPHQRKHGPEGYSDYADYKDWLRDEFDFRCVYCLRRESWAPRRAVWAVEHLIPRKDRKDLATIYSNLVYACATCNSWKSADRMPDPCKVAYGDLVLVDSDGRIRALKPKGKTLIKVARLDDADSTEFRRKYIRLIRNLYLHDREEYYRWMGFPEDLPDLANRSVKRNSKPEGARDCRFEQRKRCELPQSY
jgi:hypothetical protein